MGSLWGHLRLVASFIQRFQLLGGGGLFCLSSVPTLIPLGLGAKDSSHFFLATPSASLVVQMVKNLPAMQETQVLSLGQEISWRR